MMAASDDWPYNEIPDEAHDDTLARVRSLLADPPAPVQRLQRGWFVATAPAIMLLQALALLVLCLVIAL